MASQRSTNPLPQRQELERILAAGDLRVLLLCLYHLTADDVWLSPAYAPQRDVRLIADPMAGFDDEQAAAIRGALLDHLERHGLAPKVTDPGPEKFAQLLSFFLGEAVPAEYVPMVRVEFGFVDETPKPRGDPAAGPRVLIVGAGACGLAMAKRLESMGVSWQLVEKNSGVGGTWFENRYPGCGVDTPNHFYCFSDHPNVKWRRYFSQAPELLAYLEDFAQAKNLTGKIAFNTTLVGARWQDDRQGWQVTLRDGGGERQEHFAVVVTATGHFNHPVQPDFPGADAFSGLQVHTAQWPQELDLTGKRVAVIGTGASAMQLVPTIAPTVQQLTIFQRTAQWARPVAEYQETLAEEGEWLFEHLPLYDRWYRFAQLWRYGDGLLRFLQRDPAWEQPQRSLNRVNERHRQEMESFIESSLAGREDLLAKCMPDYPAFAKRILIDNGWFKTLRRDNVALVTEPLKGFTAQGIETTDGAEYDCDVIIYATGFNVTSLASRIDFVGRGGRSLAEDWAEDNPRALLGMAVPAFPNLFIMYGPNTNMGHGGSGMWLAETQSAYIAERLGEMMTRDLAVLECKDEEREVYCAEVDRLHSELIWSHPATGTYYRNRNGQVRSPMPFRLVDYWTMTRQRGLEDYHAEPGHRTGQKD